MKYTQQQRVFMVQKYAELKTISKVKTAWRAQFSRNNVPATSTIKNNVSKFQNTGSVLHIPRKTRIRTQKVEAAKNKLKIIIAKDPSLSIAKCSSNIGVSTETTRSLLLDDLHLKPYKQQECHDLERKDFKKRKEFALWFLDLPKSASSYLICTDEAYFGLTEAVNKQNNRQWLESRPNQVIARPLHDQKVLVWCAISAKKIYGPFFFENYVNQHNYLDMLKTFFWPKHLKTAEYKKYYFQQDGAGPHKATMVQSWLKSKFGNRFIHKKMWPPYSPDLTPCDFFLWGYLKSVVYNPLPKTLDDLKANIKREIEKINVEILKSTFENFEKRCHLVIAADGGLIEPK